jgi:molybdopterin/thiamine biosynthesis adenylyltransferase/rhodanese-related sulfurtransferase
VGTIGIIDGDRIERTNLHRQIIFADSDCGAPKATVAAQALYERNPHLQLVPLATHLTPDNGREVVESFDLVIDGCDNFATRYLINDLCVELGKPFVASSIERFEGQLSVYNAELSGVRGPTYRCLFPEPPPAHTAPTCTELGVLGTVPGVMGVLQANEAIKLIAGFGEPLVGRLLVLNLLTLSARIVAFQRQENAVTHGGLRPPEYYRSLPGSCETGPQVQQVTPAQVREWVTQQRPFELLDVREPAERAAASIGGIHIPLRSLPARLSELPGDLPLVVYCHSGVRSQQAAEFILSTLKRDQVFNLRGGIVAWYQT